MREHPVTDQVSLAIAPGRVHVWAADLDRGIGQDPRAVLDRDERRRADRFVSPVHRSRWATAHAFLRHVLAAYLGTHPAELRFVVDDGGKPHLAGDNPLEFSLAHSGSVGLLALGRSCDVGVDVERTEVNHDLVAIARRALPPPVAGRIESCPVDRRTGCFYRAWTRHEAATKCTGAGIVEPGADAGFDGVAVTDLHVGAGYSAALAIRPGPAAVERFRWVDAWPQPGGVWSRAYAASRRR